MQTLSSTTAGKGAGLLLRALPMALFLLTIPAGSWIADLGSQPDPNGPHLIPIGFGLLAPPDVITVGAGLVLRNVVQRVQGFGWGLAAIAIGAALTGLMSEPPYLVASVGTFLLAQVVNMAIYTPLARHGFALAVAVASAVGGIVDSAAFMWIAFGSLDHILELSIGKIWISVLAVPVILLSQRLTPVPAR
jgi:hypothetical protein